MQKRKELQQIISLVEFKFQGRGKYFFSNGDRYEGEFNNGEREGEGIMFLNNGGFRTGTWRNDQLVAEVCLQNSLLTHSLHSLSGRISQTGRNG